MDTPNVAELQRRFALLQSPKVQKALRKFDNSDAAWAARLSPPAGARTVQSCEAYGCHDKDDPRWGGSEWYWWLTCGWLGLNCIDDDPPEMED